MRPKLRCRSGNCGLGSTLSFFGSNGSEELSIRVGDSGTTLPHVLCRASPSPLYDWRPYAVGRALMLKAFRTQQPHCNRASCLRSSVFSLSAGCCCALALGTDCQALLRGRATTAAVAAAAISSQLIDFSMPGHVQILFFFDARPRPNSFFSMPGHVQINSGCIIWVWHCALQQLVQHFVEFDVEHAEDAVHTHPLVNVLRWAAHVATRQLLAE